MLLPSDWWELSRDLWSTAELIKRHVLPALRNGNQLQYINGNITEGQKMCKDSGISLDFF